MLIQKSVVLIYTHSRSSRVSRYSLGAGRILYRPRNRDRLLDHLWYQIYGWRVVLETSLPAANGSRLCSHRRRRDSPLLPRWLASKDRYEEALQSLSKLRRLPTTDKRVRQEFLDIQAEVRFHQEMNAEKHPNLQGGGLKDAFLLEMASWADCFKPGCWKRTHIGVGLMFFQQVSTKSPLLLTFMTNF